MMRILALLAALALASPANAHVEIAASAPAAGAAVKPPKAITLTFGESVDPATLAAQIVMTAMPGHANHGEMTIRNFTAAQSADGRTLTLTLKKPLPEGSYDVRWQAAGADGHLVEGTLTFVVE